MRALALLVLLAAGGGGLGCRLVPDTAAGGKSPGDNHYRLVINGNPERYEPGAKYVVTLVGSQTHEHLQIFSRFKLVSEPLSPSSPQDVQHQGQFMLFADTISKFHEECTNTVVEADDIPKTEVQVMWKAPVAGSGCVNIKAMVLESDDVWFAEDGQLTRRVCEETRRDTECCACDDAKYKMVFEGVWSPQTHPKDFPTALWLTHFSDVIGATHYKNFSFWGEGKIATDGFRSLAEWGSVQLLQRELQQQGRSLRSIVKAAGLWHPRLNSNTSATFTVDRGRHLLSVASMFGPSPDWVVGVSGLDLCRKDCTWEPHTVVDLYPYDAGTDGGITYMSPNVDTIPREKMYRITPMYPEDPRAPFYNPGAKEVPPLARLHLTREQLVPRSCNEQLLQQMVVEVSENTESVSRPECATSDWSTWTACSVTCGKGLRMRSRAYLVPAKAAMFSCDRQLVSKEMCVAAVAECEESAAPAEELGFAPEPEAGGVCETGPWGPWSECSVSCGVGINTRRRAFRHPMGSKKCPLVNIVEDRKCMQPACQETEADISDPACPTTAWSRWSPCSASCGRGVRLRSRLLLVPPDRQEDCSARVELIQQQPCLERDSCDVDMPTVKQMCMSEADPGPCRGRGVSQRWAFSTVKGMCVPFLYNGCLGNQNNFLTQQDCMATCKVVADALSVGGGGGQQPGVIARAEDTVGGGGGGSSDCRVSAWSAWSACNVSCGTGYQEVSRTVLSPAGPGGAPCPSRLTRRRKCRRNC